MCDCRLSRLDALQSDATRVELKLADVDPGEMMRRVSAVGETHDKAD